MTNNKVKSLTNGRLTDARVGSLGYQGVGSNQSNYLVTNDGVQTMDLPRNMVGPRYHEKSNRSTPLLIPPLKYITYNNPQVTYDFLVSKGYNVEPTIPSTYQFARIFVKENGDPGILELVKAAHPDAALILKATGHKEDSSFCSGNSSNFDTKSSEAAATSENKTTVEPKTDTPSKTEKAEEWIKLNKQTIIIILVIIIFFLFINKGLGSSK